uniref:TIMELESS-interacting protein n=1 Tax=Peronospora matthiolae TaxID=2874970 RepID=A0AAV1V681_9STRA
MDRPGNLLEDKALAEFLGVEDVDFDSGSDTKVEGEERYKPSASVRGDIAHPAPNPFPKCSAATAPTALGAMSPMGTSIITNPLQEEQQRMLDQAASARRKL